MLTNIIALGSQRIFFIQSNNRHILTMHNPDGQFKDPEDLTTLTSAPATHAKSSLSCYLTGSSPHLIFHGADSQIYEIFGANSKWKMVNITQRTSSPPSIPGYLCAYSLVPRPRGRYQSQHIYGITADRSLLHYYHPSRSSRKWTVLNVSKETGAPPLLGNLACVGPSSIIKRRLSMVYVRDSSDSFHQFFWREKWQHQHISSIAQVIPQSPLPCQSSESKEEMKEEEEEEKRECLICMDSSASHVLTPCGHVGLCEECSETLRKEQAPSCPVCRKRVESFVKLFFV